jgi:hypothetical protein
LEALELEAPEFEALGLAPAAALDALEALALVAPDDAAGGADVVDDAAQPAARSPAPSSGTSSATFLTGAPDYGVTDDGLCPL